MKNLTKKHGFYAAAAALLVLTAMLVTIGCSNDMGGLGYNDEYTPPAGMGAIKLSFNEKINTRSIFPDALGIGSFDSFDFVFKLGATELTKTVLKANIGNPIALDPGTYSLTVTAYIGSKAVATGTYIDTSSSPLNTFTIIAAKTTTGKTITLKPFDPEDAEEDGTFKYNIFTSILTDLSTATINFLPTNGDPAYATVDLITGDLTINSVVTPGSDTLIDGADHTISLPAGYYYLDFVIKAKSGDEVTFREILLISQNMTSTYPSFSIKKDYFYGSLTVVLDYEDTEDIKPVIINFDGTNTTYYGEHEDAVLGGDAETPVEITKGVDAPLALEVENYNYFDSIEWYTQGNTALTGASGTKNKDYTVNPNAVDGIFSMKKLYKLTVIGTKGGVKYSSYVYILVK